MKVEINSKKQIFSGFLSIEEAELTIERFDGGMIQMRRQYLERGDAVAALLFNCDTRRLVMVNQFKYPTYAKGPGWLTEIIAGMIDSNETPLSAIKREVLEESGYKLAEGAFHSIATFYLSPGGSSERVFLYYAEVGNSDKSSAGGGRADEQEDILVVEMSLDESAKRNCRWSVGRCQNDCGITLVSVASQPSTRKQLRLIRGCCSI